MRLTRRALTPILVGLLALQACTEWHARAPLTPVDTLAQRERLQLWVGGRAYDVHGVVVFGDSVSVIPYFDALGCRTCELRFALAAIDSVRTRAHSPERSKAAGSTAAVTILILVLVGIAIGAATAGAISGGGL